MKKKEFIEKFCESITSARENQRISKKKKMEKRTTDNRRNSKCQIKKPLKWHKPKKPIVSNKKKFRIGRKVVEKYEPS